MSIKTAVLNGVASIELANVQRKNTLNDVIFTELLDALKMAAEDPQIKVVLLHGQPEYFCMGTELENFTQTDFTDSKSPLREFMHALIHFEKPIVAAVNGSAIGVGTTMLLHCDLVYASDTAIFALPFTSLGLVPDFAATYILPRRIGRMRANEKLLLAQPFSAQEAFDIGLINGVLPEKEVLNYARTIAERFNKLPPQAVRSTKHLLRASALQEVDVAIEAEMTAMAKQVQGQEVKEAISAFLEKRWPEFGKFE